MVDTHSLPAGSWAANGTGIEVRAVCGCMAPVVLEVCAANDVRPGCFVRANDTSAVVIQHDTDRCSSAAAEEGSCSLCPRASLQAGECRAGEQSFTYAALSGGTITAVAFVVAERIADATANFSITLSAGAVAAGVVRAGGAGGSLLAAAAQSAAYTYIQDRSQQADACSLGGLLTQDVALCTEVQVDESADQTAEVQLTLALGIALRGDSVSEARARVLDADAQACVRRALLDGVNTTSLSAALLRLRQLDGAVDDWKLAGAAAGEVQAGQSQCGEISSARAREQWVEATTEAMAVDLQLFNAQARCQTSASEG